MIDISQQIEQFCGVLFATTEQHVDARTSRISRDTIDVNKFFDWFKSHDHFTKLENVMSISTGVIGNKEINWHLAYEIGIESMSNVIGSNFGQVKFQRKNRVMPLRGFTSKVKMYDEEIPVSPDIIFLRISYMKKSDEEFKEYFKFKLAPYPLTIR